MAIKQICVTGVDLTCRRPLLCKPALPLRRMSSWNVKPFLLFVFSSCSFSLLLMVACAAILRRANLSLNTVGPEREGQRERGVEKKRKKRKNTTSTRHEERAKTDARATRCVTSRACVRFCDSVTVIYRELQG